MRFEILCPANSALPHAHVEREAQAARPSSKRGQLTTLLSRLHPAGGTVSELCCISVRGAIRYETVHRAVMPATVSGGFSVEQ